jgi:hypothetical protein
MNLTQPFVVAIMAVILALVACKKEGGANIETSRMERAFAGAEASLKAAADKAVEAVKKADYSAALAELKGLTSNIKLTDAQRQAVNDLIVQIQNALSGEMNKAADGANKTFGDAQKAIGK